MRRVLFALAGAALFAAFGYWRLEQQVRRWLGLGVTHNCATWAADHWDYGSGGGVMLLKSISGWFPHVGLIYGAHCEDRKELVIAEYIPRNRVPKWLPPRKFDGEVRVTRFVRVED
jgi:hypothetical protein